MTTPDDVAVVWIEQAEVPTDAQRAITDWARARGLKVLSTSDTPRAKGPRLDPALADRLEKELDRAREAIAALDADQADRALARAEALVREHPELPQAAWLRAEIHRSWAARWARLEPRDDARAESAWQDAQALDGGRAAGVGEIAFPARAKVPVTFRVPGPVVVLLDGIALPPSADGAFAIDVTPAEHQLVVMVDGETVFAEWVAIAALPAGAPRAVIPIVIGDQGACAASSFGGVLREGTSVRAESVACGQWVAVVATERRGAILVARCARDACGPFVEWRSESSLASGPNRASAPHRGGWPAWATWTAVGVGAVAATTITLIATGVLESRPIETRFVNGGVRTE